MERSSKDLDRIISNQKNLLETIPAMVLLVKESQSIEYMNPSAKSFLGNLCKLPKNFSPEEKAKNRKISQPGQSGLLQDKQIGDTLETTLWGISFRIYPCPL